MPVREALKILGVPYSSYYRWKRQEAWNSQATEPIQPVRVYEALPEEKAAVKKYALANPDIRHRELAWRMIDEGGSLFKPIDGLPHFARRKLDESASWEKEAIPRGARESKPSRSDLGNRLHVSNHQ